LFADLHASGQYRMNRAGYYQRHDAHSTGQAAEITALLTARNPMSSTSEVPA
jgi:hypothetical protein